jgi:hypothetical protein
MVAFSNIQIQALASGNRYGPTRRITCSTGSGIGGSISPRALNLGNGYTLISGVSNNVGGTPAQVVCKIKNSTGEFVETINVSFTPGQEDDHNSNRMIKVNSGTQLLMTWNDHNADRNLYSKLSSDLSLDNLGSLVTTQASVGHLIAYGILMEQASTGNVFQFNRVGELYWACFKSTNFGASWTYLGEFFFNDVNVAGSRTLMNMVWADASTIRCFIAAELGVGDSRIRCMDINVDTNAMVSGSGTLGTFGTDIINMSAISIIFNPGSGFGAFMQGTKSPTAVIAKHQVDATEASSYYWMNCDTPAAPYTEASWSKYYITDAGEDLNSKWEGGICLSGLTTTNPEVYISKLLSSDHQWHLGRWAASDAVGSTWSEVEVIAVGGDNVDSPLFRPVSPAGADPSLPVSYQYPGQYPDFSNFAMQMSW